jgi:ATP-binding cassette, subfamily B, bacterial MsbA
MKTYLRILRFARPLENYIIPFFIFSTLASLFGVFNFVLLQPLLNILFDKVTPEVLAELNRTPQPALDVQYLVQLFNFYFGKILAQYGKTGALQFVCLFIVLSVLLSNVFKYLSMRVLQQIKATTIFRLRQTVFDKTLSLHLGYFTNERKGDIVSRITTDVQEVENSVGKAFTAIFKEPFTLIIYFIILFRMSFTLTLFTLVLIPLSGLIIGGLSKRLKDSARKVQANLSNVISMLDEVFGGMRVVKAFRGESIIRERFLRENNSYRSNLLRMYYRQDLASPLSEFMGVSVVAMILLYGGSLVISGQPGLALSASAFITYIIIFSQVLRPAKEISDAVSSLQRGAVASERILTLIDTQSAIQEKQEAIVLPSLTGKIEFSKVNFSYGEKKVLNDISFTLPKGTTLALVGTSGGGKSTIADLLPRFYDVNAGSIRIDGTDIRDCTLDSLRSQMGIVTQESVLFNDTIFNNITFGNSGATLEEVMQAARIANAHDFIMQTENGYQHFIGDRGAKLSGGQRQRIAIARAILKNPPILILDEATSALDAESEQLVQDALTQLMRNRTTLVIAHRLSTIQHADKILVIQNGRIVEEGNHQSLLELNKGIYQGLVERQHMA